MPSTTITLPKATDETIISCHLHGATVLARPSQWDQDANGLYLYDQGTELQPGDVVTLILASDGPLPKSMRFRQGQVAWENWPYT